MQFDQVFITTSRLHLRPLQLADATAVFALRSNPEVSRYTGYATWSELKQAEEFIAGDLNGMASGRFLRLGVVLQESGDLIGTVVLFHLDDQCRRAEIGYDMRPDQWGRGYMNEALAALLELGYTGMMLNRIEADVDPANTTSINTLKRLGFRQEGLMRERWIVNGARFDTAFFGLLQSEWMARRQS